MDLNKERISKNRSTGRAFTALLVLCLIVLVVAVVSMGRKDDGSVALVSPEAVSPVSSDQPVSRKTGAKLHKAPVGWWQKHQMLASLDQKWWIRHQERGTRQQGLSLFPVAGLEEGTLPVGREVERPAVSLPLRGETATIVDTHIVDTHIAGSHVELPARKPLRLKWSQFVSKPLHSAGLFTQAVPFALKTPLTNDSFALSNMSNSKNPAITLARQGELPSLRMAEANGLVPELYTMKNGEFVPFRKDMSSSEPETETDHAPEAAQCLDSEIAGWSNRKLLAKHRQMLARSKAVPDDVSERLAERLAKGGFTPGAPIYMRIFKDRSELEIWLEKNGRFALFQTFKICRWSGTFGPKLYEGDRQSPEGFYRVDDALFNRHSWKWKGSFSIGYPNAYDKLHGRTGSLILVHGGCTSVGCFALTNPVIKVVHELAQLARDHGQKAFAIHVFPFRLTNANLERHKNSPWLDFWKNLKQGYDLFEKTKTLPKISVCNKRYVFNRLISHETEKEAGTKGEEKCYSLQAKIPGWRPAPRYARRRGYRRSAHRTRTLGLRVKCNYNRPSCRKWIALRSRRGRQHTGRRRLARAHRHRSSRRHVSRRRIARRNHSRLGRVNAIGRRHKRK